MPRKCALVAVHGRALMRAVLQGFAGVSPRSVAPNLIEVLSTLMSRAGTTVETNDSGTASEWMKEVIFSVSVWHAKCVSSPHRISNSLISSRIKQQ